jgi:SAM-dependent methyltransferase
MAVKGTAVGIDLSAQMIERARQLSEAEGVRNITFEVADAQVHHFPPKHFDVAISRFGTMFFADPVAAFANIGRALRPAARLVMMVWQDHHRNEWSVSIQRSLSGSEQAPTPAPGTLDPFSLADPTAVERILDAAGFTGVTFGDVQEPVFYGRDVSSALDFVGRFTCTNDALTRLGPASAERALDRLRETLAAHADERGVWFDSHAWIVTARRR